jgi:dTDP-4-amino-4,6-dideoxygalactose transaminase
VPTESSGNTSVYHLYVIRTPKRDELQAFLKDQGVFTGIHYPIPVHLQAATKFLGYKQGDFPVTEQVVSQILSLPMYAELVDDEIKYVTDAINTFLS